MWYLIYPGAAGMIHIEGMTGRQSLKILHYALNELLNDPEKFKLLNPENGWGSYQGFINYIERLIELAETNSNWIWEACR
jgi:hypothetical protein